MVLMLLLAISAAITSISASHTYLEIKPGYFFMLNEPEKSILHNGGADVGVELGTDIFCYLRLGLEARFFGKTGTALNTCCKNTKLRISSLTPWLKFIMPAVHGIRPYVGVGPQIQWVRTYNNSPYVQRYQHTATPASVYTLGLQCTYNHLFIDPFVQFQTGKAYFNPGIASVTYPVSTRGIKVGCGVGYTF